MEFSFTSIHTCSIQLKEISVQTEVSVRQCLDEAAKSEGVTLILLCLLSSKGNTVFRCSYVQVILPLSNWALYVHTPFWSWSRMLGVREPWGPGFQVSSTDTMPVAVSRLQPITSLSSYNTQWQWGSKLKFQLVTFIFWLFVTHHAACLSKSNCNPTRRITL